MTDKQAMATKYTEIAIEEMDDFLRCGFHALEPKQGKFSGIYYYDLHLSKAVAIRVWTSIRVHSSSAKDKGEGSIKALLISLKDNNGLEADENRQSIVMRTTNWRDNLADRIESLMEKYDDRSEWWDQWALNRKRRGDADRAYREEERQEHVREHDREEEERARDEDGEGSGPPKPAAPPVRQYDPARMQGGITPPQINYLRVLMHGMTPARWKDVGAPEITGLDDPPRGPADVRGLSKGQASRLIDALKGGASRHAAMPELAPVGNADSEFLDLLGER